MNKLLISIYALSIIFGLTIAAEAADESSFEIPPGVEYSNHEQPTFHGSKNPQEPGTALNAPGDTWVYTFFIRDEYLDPEWKLTNESIAIVHITDHDWSKEKGDTANEWGSILINGKAVMTTLPEMLKQMGGYRFGQAPLNSAFLEIECGSEAHPSGQMPAYIFNLKDIEDSIKEAGKVVIQITNLRQDGSINGTAPFGDFIVNRLGLHLFWTK
jgi:hypothetical protein